MGILYIVALSFRIIAFLLISVISADPALAISGSYNSRLHNRVRTSAETPFLEQALITPIEWAKAVITGHRHSDGPIRSAVRGLMESTLTAAKGSIRTPIKIKAFRGGEPGLSMEHADDDEVALMDLRTHLPTGTSALRKRVHTEKEAANFPHMSVHIYFRYTGKYGKGLLLQRRSQTVSSPGRIQVSASGHVDFDNIRDVSDYTDPQWVKQVAIREVAEETGYTPTMDQLILVTGINEIIRKEPKNYEGNTVLMLDIDDDGFDKIIAGYNTNEVEEMILIAFEDLADLVRRDPDRKQFSNSLHNFIDNHLTLLAKMQNSPPTLRHNGFWTWIQAHIPEWSYRWLDMPASTNYLRALFRWNISRQPVPSQERLTKPTETAA